MSSLHHAALNWWAWWKSHPQGFLKKFLGLPRLLFSPHAHINSWNQFFLNPASHLFIFWRLQAVILYLRLWETFHKHRAVCLLFCHFNQSSAIVIQLLNCFHGLTLSEFSPCASVSVVALQPSTDTQSSLGVNVSPCVAGVLRFWV